MKGEYVMAIFDTEMDFPEITTTESKNEKQYFEKRARKCLKLMKKCLEKKNRLLEIEVQRREAEAAEAEKKRSGSANSFLQDLGRSITKAIPHILTTLVVTVISFLFKGHPNKKGAHLTT